MKIIAAIKEIELAMRKMLAVKIVKWVCVWDLQAQSSLLTPGMRRSMMSFRDRIVDRRRRIIQCITHWTITVG